MAVSGELRAGLGDLPAEIIYVILEFCEKTDIAALSRTCRFFESLTIPNIYREMIVDYSPGDRRLNRLYESFVELLLFNKYKLQHVRTFSVYGDTKELLKTSMKDQRSEDQRILGPFLRQTLPRALKSMTALESWRWEVEHKLPVELPLILNSLQQVKYIFLKPSWWEELSIKGVLQCDFPNLEMLWIMNLRDHHAISQLLRLALKCSQLRALCLETSGYYDDHGDVASDLQVLLRSMALSNKLKSNGLAPRRLSYLKIDRWRERGFAQIQPLLMDVTSLYKLEIDIQGDRSLQAWNAVAGKLVNVRILKFGIQLISQAIRFLRSFRKLERLLLIKRSTEVVVDGIYQLLELYKDTLKVFGVRYLHSARIEESYIAENKRRFQEIFRSGVNLEHLAVPELHFYIWPKLGLHVFPNLETYSTYANEIDLEQVTDYDWVKPVEYIACREVAVRKGGDGELSIVERDELPSEMQWLLCYERRDMKGIVEELPDADLYE